MDQAADSKGISNFLDVVMYFIMTISTTDMDKTYEQISQIILEENIDVYEIRSAKASLDDLFSSLMKIHRGDAG